MPDLTDLGARPVLIAAHGLGTRMAAHSGGRAKTLLPVAGVPILARLVEALTGRASVLLVTVRPEDAELDAFAAALDSAELPVRRLHRRPDGYLVDVAAVIERIGTGVGLSVLDCDVLVRPAELAAFLDVCAEPAGRELGVIGVSAHPPSPDPRSIRLGVDAEGRAVLGDPCDPALPRTMGAYHWHPAGLRAIEDFVAAARGSFHAFAERLALDGAALRIVPFSAALNVNAPEDLLLAECEVAGWGPRVRAPVGRAQ